MIGCSRGQTKLCKFYIGFGNLDIRTVVFLLKESSISVYSLDSKQ